MKPDFRKSMIWLHTYSGLVIGWLLFTIFVTGTLSYFNPEISQWMKPELQHVSTTENMINRSLQKLHSQAYGAENWRIYLPDNRNEHWYIQWRKGKDRQSVSLGPEQDSELTIRETASGNFFRVFHYTLQLRGYGGRYLAGVAAMFMLVAVFSGIFTHRRFFRDFFTLRLSKLTKTLTDFHALAGIVTIPFCLMICSSGILIYAVMYMPWSAEHYAGGQRELSRALSPGLAKINQQTSYQTPIKDFSLVQGYIQQQWPGQNQIRRITFEQPYNQDGRIIVDRVKAYTLSRQSERLVFSSASGEPLTSYPEASTAAKVRRVFFGLHEAHFANISLRWLLFLLGVISCALIATGLIIWLNKRLEKVKKRHLGHFVVERLNITAIAGLPLAIIAFFLGNRLLPIELINRADAEVKVFLWAWLACGVHAFVRRDARSAWIELLFAAALGCFLLPLLDLYDDSDRLVNALIQTDITYLGFAFAIVTAGVSLFKITFWLKSRAINMAHDDGEGGHDVR